MYLKSPTLLPFHNTLTTSLMWSTDYKKCVIVRAVPLSLCIQQLEDVMQSLRDILLKHSDQEVYLCLIYIVS